MTGTTRKPWEGYVHGAKVMKLAVALTASAMLAATTATMSTAEELVSYKVVDDTIPESLTGQPGDAANGRKLYLNRKKGNCLACHATKDMADEPFHGNVGPPMDGVASRYSEAELRMRIVNPKVVNPDTIMPAFYRADGFHRVMKDFQGKTVISAQDVEDIIAYLMTMKDE